MSAIAVNPLTVAQVISQGGYWTRLAVAKALGRKKTSHVINQIEMAYLLGYCNRVQGHDGKQECWMYTVEKELF